MLPRRLHLQIYLTILACLTLVVILSSAFWVGFGRDRNERDLIQVAERLAALTLPDVSAPDDAQADAATRLAKALDAELVLLAPDRRLLFATPAMAKRARNRDEGKTWRRRGGGFKGALSLADGRRLIVAPSQRPRSRPLLGLAAFVAIIALAVGVGAYPFSRRLTRRLEALQDSVDQMGSGDLSARAEISGRDEIATLALRFNHAAEEIERLVEGRRLLLAHASHELRTPLARIRLGATMVERDPDPARFAALRQDLDEIEELIEALLLASRLDAVPGAIASELVDIVALVAEECAHYDDCTIEGNVQPVSGDATLLRRMIRNLLDNAHTHGAPPVLISLTDDQTHIALTISDAGPGFGPDPDDTLFEPFQRGRDRQNVKGYGLGLALVRQIAEAHGGTAKIGTDSQSGVTVTLKR